MPGDQEYKRYARQVALKNFGAEAQEKLLASSVLVIGAGGLGCPALLYLAGAGIGRIGIVDHDVVSMSNLHRQVLYKVSDIGKLKVDCAAGALLALNPGIEVSVFPFSLTTENAFELISRFDVIIDGTDHFSARYMINDACVLLGKPLVYGAVSGFEGQVSVFNLEDASGTSSAHYRHLFPQPPQEELIPNCEEAGVLGVLPGIIGTMQANETIKIISGVGKPLANQLMTYNALNSEVFSFEIPLSSGALTFMPKSREEFERKDYILECADPSRAIFTIDIETFERLRSNDNVTVVDVREAGEEPEVNEFSHIRVPLSRLNNEMDFLPGGTIITFCQVGQRSLIAARALAEYFGAGKKVFSLGGGIVNWKKSLAHEGEKA